MDLVTDSKAAKTMRVLFDLLEPVVRALRMCDGNMPAMGFIYPVMFEIKEFAANSKQMDADLAAFLKHLSQCIEQRWTYLHNDYHAAAYALNLRYWDFGADILANSEVMGGLHRTLRKLCSGPGETAQAIDEFSGLHFARKGTFEGGDVLAAANCKFVHKPIVWKDYGQSAVVLWPRALRVTSKHPAASPCEQNWSYVDYILDKCRMRLTSARINKLVYCYANIRFLHGVDSGDQGYYEWAVPDQVEPYHSESSEDEAWEIVPKWGVSM
jgi:hypothetical protein